MPTQKIATDIASHNGHTLDHTMIVALPIATLSTERKIAFFICK